MSKKNRESRVKQMNKKVHGMEPFQYQDGPYFRNDSFQNKDGQTETAVDQGAIELKAYQIYCEKGGTALENWLEAERSLSNHHSKQKEAIRF